MDEMFPNLSPEPLGGPPGGLYIVYRKNPYVSKGTFLYLDDDGFQRVKVKSRGRQQTGASRGKKWRIQREPNSLIFPYSQLRPFVIRVQKPRERPE